MKILNLFSHKTALFLLLLSTLSYSQKNYVESFNVSDNVAVSVNSSYTNIIFETWNKNKVEVEAFIEGEKLSETEKQELMKNWDLNISGNSKKISISSDAGRQVSAMDAIPNMDFIGPLLENLVMPMVQNVKVPPLPKELFENLGSIQFDYEAYKKDEKGYLKKFEAQMDKKFGKDFEKKMEDWGRSFEKSWDNKKADSLGDAFEQNMEAWGDSFGKSMEAWEKQFEDQGGNYTKTVTKSPNGTSIVVQGNSRNSRNGSAKKTIIIRLPKNASTDINVRYGDLKMADANNLKADLNYTAFTANTVDGKETVINAAYAAVVVNTWKQGALNVKYVDQCNIQNVQNLNLQANSSDVKIGNITKQAFLSGCFGDLTVAGVSDGFETLDISLENTDARVKIPSGAFSFYFNGKKSTLKYPKSLQLKESKNADRVLVKGFNQSAGTTKTITINSTYSNVSLQ